MENKHVYPSEWKKVTKFGTQYICNEGITKRELFAAMAMQGLLSNPTIINKVHGNSHIEWIKVHSILRADALLKELEKQD
jgi:hypothetical protein